MIFKILAILGALAWLPHLISLIRNSMVKPNLTIISHKELEVGYTTFGPILNISLAFLAEKKKALIRKIDIELTHEKKETQKFTWDWFEEILLEMGVPETGIIPYIKHQKSIAIKTGADELIEKKIGFQESIFKDQYSRLIKAVNEDALNIYNSGKDLSDLKATSNYNRLLDHLKNSFNWKVGRYSGLLKVYISEKEEPFEHRIDFQLNSLDIKTLESNVDICKAFVEKTYINRDLPVQGTWRWVNPYKLTDEV